MGTKQPKRKKKVIVEKESLNIGGLEVSTDGEEDNIFNGDNKIVLDEFAETLGAIIFTQEG